MTIDEDIIHDTVALHPAKVAAVEKRTTVEVNRAQSDKINNEGAERHAETRY